MPAFIGCSSRFEDEQIASIRPDQERIQGKVRNPYFLNFQKVLAKITAKNQLTLPKSVTEPLGPVQYFDVQTRGGQIVLTPVRIQRGDALRAKLAELALSPKTLDAALSWAETQMGGVKTMETPKKAGGAKAAKPLSPAARKEEAPQKAEARKTGSPRKAGKPASAAKTIETQKTPPAARRAKPLSAESKPTGGSTASRQRTAKPSSATAGHADKTVAKSAAKTVAKTVARTAAKALAPAARRRATRGMAASRRVA